MRASRPVPSRGVKERVKGECQRRERQEVGEGEQAGRTTRVLLERRYLASLGPVLLVLYVGKQVMPSAAGSRVLAGGGRSGGELETWVDVRA